MCVLEAHNIAKRIMQRYTATQLKFLESIDVLTKIHALSLSETLTSVEILEKCRALIVRNTTGDNEEFLPDCDASDLETIASWYTKFVSYAGYVILDVILVMRDSFPSFGPPQRTAAGTV